MARAIVLDTETTGLDPRTGHRLIEIGCVEVVDYMPTGRTFHRYIHPERDIDPDAERVHGISLAMLEGKPLIDWEWILEHLDDIAESILQHVQLTVIPLAIGFVLSMILAVWAIRILLRHTQTRSESH